MFGMRLPQRRWRMRREEVVFAVCRAILSTAEAWKDVANGERRDDGEEDEERGERGEDGDGEDRRRGSLAGVGAETA